MLVNVSSFVNVMICNWSGSMVQILVFSQHDFVANVMRGYNKRIIA